MSSVGIGIIGTGSIADDCHAPAISGSGGFLAAVLTRDERSGQAFLERHSESGGRVHTSIESLAADDNVNCVIVASPDRLHAEHALACLRAGKDVLLEKPMAISVDEARALADIAKQNKLILAVGFHLRFHRGHQELFRRVTVEKEIGNLRHIRAIWAFPQKDDDNWRASNELGKWWSLAAVGSHCFDLVRWFSEDAEEWSSFGATIGRQVWQGPHDETAVIAAQLASGPTVEIVSSVQFGPFNRLELYGDSGSAVCQDTFGRKGGGIITINENAVPFEQGSPFVTQLRNFVECVAERREPIANSVAGVRNVQDLLRTCDV